MLSLLWAVGGVLLNNSLGIPPPKIPSAFDFSAIPVRTAADSFVAGKKIVYMVTRRCKNDILLNGMYCPALSADYNRPDAGFTNMHQYG